MALQQTNNDHKHMRAAGTLWALSFTLSVVAEAQAETGHFNVASMILFHTEHTEQIMCDTCNKGHINLNIQRS